MLDVFVGLVQQLHRFLRFPLRFNAFASEQGGDSDAGYLDSGGSGSCLGGGR